MLITSREVPQLAESISASLKVGSGSPGSALNTSFIKREVLSKDSVYLPNPDWVLVPQDLPPILLFNSLGTTGKPAV